MNIHVIAARPSKAFRQLFRLMLPRWVTGTRVWRSCRWHSTLLPLAGDKDQIVFSGIQPTGTPHLGNYLGALQTWANLQQQLPASATIIYSIVDLHAITVAYSPDVLRLDREEMWRVLHAVDIDMERCIVFEQSAVRSQHATIDG